MPTLTAPPDTAAPAPARRRPAPTRAAALGHVGLHLVAGFVLVYLFLPIFVIVAFSFNKPGSASSTSVWKGFTLDNWADPFAYRPLVDALEPQPPHRRHLDGDRDGARHVRARSRWCATGSGAGAVDISWCCR